MRIYVNRYTAGLTPWGIFTNLFSGEEFWYFHIHTPKVQVQVYETK